MCSAPLLALLLLLLLHVFRTSAGVLAWLYGIFTTLSGVVTTTQPSSTVSSWPAHVPVCVCSRGKS
jgi:hypothetical protein